MLLASVVGMMSAKDLIVAALTSSSQSSLPQGVRNIINDLYLSSRAMYLSLLTGLLYTLAYLKIMRKYAKELALFSVFLFELVILA